MSSTDSIQLSPRRFAIINATICSAAVAFLVWLIYFHEGSSGESDPRLPAFNALFNSTSALLLVECESLRSLLRALRQVYLGPEVFPRTA